MQFLKNLSDKSFLLYLLIGFFNTLFGLLVIFILIFLSTNIYISNFIGYMLGFLMSYYLNKKYNFKSGDKHRKELPKFLLSMLFAYLINLFVLSICFNILKIDIYLSQTIASIFYVIVGYLFSKKIVFKIKE